MGGNADINPLHSSMFTGAGTPWGPMQTGDPGAMPTVPGQVDPETMKAFDQSAMVHNLISGLRSQGSQEQMAAQRQASRQGAGMSDASRANMQGINADVQNRAAGVGLQAAQDAWNSKLQQAQFQDQMNMQRYNAAMQQWQAAKGMYEGEKAGRSAGLKNMYTLGASGILNDVGNMIKK